MGSGSARTTVTSRPAGLQDLGHLQPDVAAAKHDRPLRPGGDRARMSAPSASRCTPYTPSASRPGHVRPRGPATGGDDEGVVADPFATGRHHLAGGQVDALGTGVGAHTDVLGGELLGRARDQPVPVADQPADPVRDPAGGVGHFRPLLEDDDLQVGGVAQAPGLRRRRQPRGVPADDDQPIGAHGAQGVILRRRPGSSNHPSER